MDAITAAVGCVWWSTINTTAQSHPSAVPNQRPYDDDKPWVCRRFFDAASLIHQRQRQLLSQGRDVDRNAIQPNGDMEWWRCTKWKRQRRKHLGSIRQRTQTATNANTHSTTIGDCINQGCCTAQVARQTPWIDSINAFVFSVSGAEGSIWQLQVFVLPAWLSCIIAANQERAPRPQEHCLRSPLQHKEGRIVFDIRSPHFHLMWAAPNFVL